MRRLICPAQDHFIFPTMLIISMTFLLSMTQMLVFLSLYVMFSILPSIWSVRAQVCSVLVWSVSRSLVYAVQHPMILRCISALVLFLEAVVLFQVHVALDIFYQHIGHVYRGVVYTITFVFAMFILRPIRLLSSDSSCSTCCIFLWCFCA